MTNSPMITPFASESEVVSLGGLTIENRLDRVSLFGSLDLTRDKAGLALAKALKANLDVVVASLEGEALPDRVAVAATAVVTNPFDGNKE